MTDSLPDNGVIPDMDDIKDDTNEKNDMFVSAIDSPTDSGLETNKTSSSDTMEDLSLQVSILIKFLKLSASSLSTLIFDAK